MLTADEQVRVTASGTIYIGALGIPSYDYEGPAGQPWGSYDCNNNGVYPFTAAGLPCWSLIGRIGNGPAFEVGSSLTFTASSSGELFLGVNDSYYADNSGSFSTAISMTPSGAGQVGPTSSTLLLVGGNIDGQNVGPGNRSVTVAPGGAITGSFTVSVNSEWHSADVMAMGVTPTWGDPATSFVDLGGFANPALGLQRTINLNLSAPTAPGTYYIIAAYNATFTAGQVMSDTNWSAGDAEGYGVGYADWATGDAVAKWPASVINTANSAGATWVSCLASTGPNETPPVENVRCYVPATAIQVVVGSGVTPGTFNPPSTATPSAPALFPLAVEITSESGSNQGFLLFSQADIGTIEHSIESSVELDGGEVNAGTVPIVGVAWGTHYPLIDLVLDILGGDSFVSFTDPSWVTGSEDITCASQNEIGCTGDYSGGQIAYAVPPGSSLVIIFPNIVPPTNGSVALSLSDRYGFWGSGSCRGISFIGSCSNTAAADASDFRNYEINGSLSGAISNEELDATGSVAFADSSPATAFTVQPSSLGVSAMAGGGGPALLDYAVSTSSSSSGSASASSQNGDGGTVTASGSGVGTVTVGQYGSTDPSTGFEVQSCQYMIFCAGPTYFDVRASEEDSFSGITVDECLTGSQSGSPTVSWWNPSGGWFGGGSWETIGSSLVEHYSTATNPGGAKCVSFTLTSATTPSISDIEGTYFSVEVPPSAVHLTTSLQSVTFNASAKEYTAFLTVANSGGAPANDVTLTAATLNTARATTAMPAGSADVPYGSSFPVFLQFPASAGAEGSHVVLRVSESYDGGTAGAGFRIVLP